MSTTPPDAPVGPDPAARPPGADDPTQDRSQEGPRVSRQDVADLGRLRRTTDGKIAGVAGGLGRHLDIDPVIVRVAFVVLAFFGGAGLLAYGACWLLLPQDGAAEAPLGLDERNRTIALAVVGVVSLVVLIGDGTGVMGALAFPWPLLVLAGVAVYVLSRRSSAGRDRPPAPYPPYPPSPGASVPPGTYGPYGQPAPYGPSAGPAGTAPYATGWVPPQPYAAPPPRNPRRRGPILFWFTLALIALGIGVLAILDLAGVDVAPSAYPALVVATTGAMLLLGAFYGRAGGLILVGLLGVGALAVTTAVDRWEGTQIDAAPATSAQVRDSYRISTGEIVLDLTGVADLDALDGRTLDLHAGAGRIEVVVPEGVDVTVDATIDGPGNIELFGSDQGGVEISRSRTHDGGLDVPDLGIDAGVGVGEIVVRTEGGLLP